MEISHIEHIGIAVPSLDEAIPFYEKMLGLKCTAIEEVADQKVRTAFFKVGQTKIELPTTEVAEASSTWHSPLPTAWLTLSASSRKKAAALLTKHPAKVLKASTSPSCIPRAQSVPSSNFAKTPTSNQNTHTNIILSK